MIKIEKLADCKGSDKFGNCSSCGSYEDKNKLLRIKYMNEGQGVSVVLCNECVEQLKRILSEVNDEKKMSRTEILEMLETINKQLDDIYDGISISEIDYHGGDDHDIRNRVFDVNNKSYLIVGKLNETRDIALGFRRRYSGLY